MKIKLLFLTSLMTILVACSPNKSAEEHIASAKSHLESSEFNEASIELKNGIKVFPKNAELRFLLGTTYLAEANNKSAEKELLKAKSLGFNLEKINTTLAKVYFLSREPQKLLTILAESQTFTIPSLITMNSHAGFAFLETGNKEQAKLYIDKALSLSADAAYSQLGDAWLKASDNEFSSAIEIINAQLQENPKFSEAIALKAHINYLQGDYTNAISLFKKHLDMFPSRNDIKLYLINSLMANKNFKEALEHINSLLKLNPRHALLNTQLAQIHFKDKNFTEAVQHADIALQSNPGMVVASVVAGISSFHQANNEQAYNYLIKVEEKLSPSSMALKLLAVLKLNLGYIDNAEQSFSDLISSDINNSQFFEVASNELLKLGKSSAAIKQIDKALEKNPKNKDLLSKRGALKLIAQDPSGISDLELAGLENETSALALGLEYIKINDLEKFNQLINKIEQGEKSNTLPLTLKALLFHHQNKQKMAAELFKEILTLESNHLMSLFYLALISEKQQEFSNAIKYYKAVIEIVPNHPEAIGNMVRVASYMKNLPQVQKYFEQIIAAQEDTIPELYIGLSLASRLALDFDSALQTLKKIEGTPNLPSEYYISLVDLNIISNKHDDAEKHLKQLIINSPNVKLYWSRLIHIYEQKKLISKALEVTKQALKIHKSDFTFELFEIHYLLTLNDNEEAEAAINQLDNAKKEHPRVRLLKGKLAVRQNKLESAITQFRGLYYDFPENETATYLALALKENKQSPLAITHLEEHIKKHNRSPAILNHLAELYLNYDTNKSIYYYTELAQLLPNNYIVYNNLAWNEFQLGQLSQAKIHAEKAFDLKANNLAIINTYTSVLTSLGNFELSKKLLSNPISNGKGNNETFIRQAYNLVNLGDKKQAKLLLDRVKTPTVEQQQKIKDLKTLL